MESEPQRGSVQVCFSIWAIACHILSFLEKAHLSLTMTRLLFFQVQILILYVCELRINTFGVTTEPNQNLLHRKQEQERQSY